MPPLALCYSAAAMILLAKPLARVLLASVAALTAVALAQQPKPDPNESPKMSDQERAQVVQLLKDTEKEFLDSVEKLTDEQWNFKPAPVNGRERWSIAECAEHIMLSESAIFGRAQAALASPVNPDWQTKTAGKTQLLLRILPDRSGKATAPEAIQPKSKLTRAEIIDRYKEARAKTLKFAETTDLDLKNHTAEHPFAIFGTLNAFNWLIYVPLHNGRHNQQIAEVKTYPGYPK